MLTSIISKFATTLFCQHRVVNVARKDDSKERFLVTSETNDGAPSTIKAFDFVVVCNRVFDVSPIPTYPGMDYFTRRVVASCGAQVSEGQTVKQRFYLSKTQGILIVDAIVTIIWQ